MDAEDGKGSFMDVTDTHIIYNFSKELNTKLINLIKNKRSDSYGFLVFPNTFHWYYFFVRWISARKNNLESKATLFISILLILFSLSMFTPWSVRLIDIIF